jgi:hypothetical protein
VNKGIGSDHLIGMEEIWQLVSGATYMMLVLEASGKRIGRLRVLPDSCTLSGRLNVSDF